MAESRKEFWIGLDVSAEFFHAAAATDGRRPEKLPPRTSRRFESNQAGLEEFAAWVRSEEARRGGTCRGIVAESTGPYSGRLAAALCAAAPDLPTLVIVNPARVHSFAGTLGSRTKTDAVDAGIIAVFAAVYAPRAHPGQRERDTELREIWRTRDALIKDRTCMKNRFRTANSTAVRAQMQSCIDCLSEAIAELEKKAERLVFEDEKLARDAEVLRTIPGIGRILSLALLAELGDLRTWSRNEIVSFLGLFPREYSSGKSVRGKTRLARGGCPSLRAGLYMSAMKIQQIDTVMRDWTRDQQTKGLAKKASLGALMRKLILTARSMVIAGTGFDEKRFRAPIPS